MVLFQLSISSMSASNALLSEKLFSVNIFKSWAICVGTEIKMVPVI